MECSEREGYYAQKGRIATVDDAILVVKSLRKLGVGKPSCPEVLNSIVSILSMLYDKPNECMELVVSMK